MNWITMIKIRSTWVLILMLCLSCSSRSGSDKPEAKPYSQDDLVRVNRYLVDKDQKIIQRTIERHGWKMQQTKSGLWYEVIEKGHGSKTEKGQYALLQFRLMLLDGTVCYSSDKEGLKQFLIGEGGVESGLEEGMLYLHQGDSARLILPPYLAYGLLGDQKRIPARSSLIYELRVLRIAPSPIPVEGLRQRIPNR